jgi:hypothetical protein
MKTEQESFRIDSSLLDAGIDIDIDMDNDDNDTMSYPSKDSVSARSVHADRHGSTALKETKQLRRVKLIFITILTLFAVGVSVFLYLTLSDTEADTFVSVYDDRANMIIDAFELNCERRIGAIDSLGIQNSLLCAGNKLYMALSYYARL